MVLWSENHVRTLLPALIIMVIVSLVLCKVLGNKSRRVRLIPFQILTCIILLLESLRLAVQGAMDAAAAQVIYVLIVIVMDILFTVGAYWFCRWLTKLFWKEKAPVSV